jgi:hypothetical protein
MRPEIEEVGMVVDGHVIEWRDVARPCETIGGVMHIVRHSARVPLDRVDH